MRLRGFVALAFVVSVLSACSGGGDGCCGGTDALMTALSGTVATNIVPADYVVQVGALGSGANPAAVAADGHYSARTFVNAHPPFLISAFLAGTGQGPFQSQYGSLVSVALGGGTANATPLTTLQVAQLIHRKPSPFGFEPRLVTDVQNVSQADIRAAQQRVVDYLLNRPSKLDGSLKSPVDVAAVTEFVSMPFDVASGDPYFEALQRLHNSLMDSETLDGVAEHMLFGNDPPAALSNMVGLDFPANCTVPSDDGTMPRGATRVTLDGRGVTFGNFDFAFETGDQLSISTGRTVDNQWQFGFTSRHATVIVQISENRVIRVVLQRTSQSVIFESDCLPVGEVTLSGKHPSVTALFRLLPASLSDPRFQCAAPSATGFVNGSNLASFEPNGAMQVNGPGGPRLHLTSLGISVSAPLVVAAGQISPLQITGFRATRTFRGGSDEVRISLTSAGLIQGFHFFRQNEQSTQSQDCGI